MDQTSLNGESEMRLIKCQVRNHPCFACSRALRTEIRYETCTRVIVSIYLRVSQLHRRRLHASRESRKASAAFATSGVPLLPWTAAIGRTSHGAKAGPGKGPSDGASTARAGGLAILTLP